MTCNVFGGTLNLTELNFQLIVHLLVVSFLVIFYFDVV